MSGIRGMCVKKACETERLAATTPSPGGGGQRHGRADDSQHLGLKAIRVCVPLTERLRAHQIPNQRKAVRSEGHQIALRMLANSSRV